MKSDLQREITEFVTPKEALRLQVYVILSKYVQELV